jgi:hypothetical protein
MQQSKEVKRNRGFRRAYLGGGLIIVILSVLVSWISVSVIDFVSQRSGKKGTPKDVTPGEGEWKQDTVFIEKTREVTIRDTVYKYVQPYVPAKTKSESTDLPKSDTTSN